MPSFCFRLWHEALEPERTNITTNQGKMNEFKVLPTPTQSLHGVGQKEPTLMPSQPTPSGSLRLGRNMSCGVPTLSIFLHPEKEKRYSCVSLHLWLAKTIDMCLTPQTQRPFPCMKKWIGKSCSMRVATRTVSAERYKPSAKAAKACTYTVIDYYNLFYIIYI